LWGGRGYTLAVARSIVSLAGHKAVNGYDFANDDFRTKLVNAVY